MHLFLIRHAQSQNNALPEHQRVEDPGITPLGVRQAEALAERLRNDTIDVLLTSAFRRALETTLPIARLRNQTPQIWTDLHEKGGCYRGHIPGRLEGRPGMNANEIETAFPGFEIPPDIGANGWWSSRPFESDGEAASRAHRQVKRLLEEFGHTSQTVACVIHADFKDLMLQAILKDDFGPQAQADLRNTSVTKFSFSDNQVETLLFNDVSHLPEELASS